MKFGTRTSSMQKKIKKNQSLKKNLVVFFKFTVHHGSRCTQEPKCRFHFFSMLFYLFYFYNNLWMNKVYILYASIFFLNSPKPYTFNKIDMYKKLFTRMQITCKSLKKSTLPSFHIQRLRRGEQSLLPPLSLRLTNATLLKTKNL